MQRPWAGAKSGSPFAAHSPPITGILCLWERSNEKVYTPTDLFFEEPCALEIACVCTRANVKRKDEERNGECRKRERKRDHVPGVQLCRNPDGGRKLTRSLGYALNATTLKWFVPQGGRVVSLRWFALCFRGPFSCDTEVRWFRSFLLGNGTQSVDRDTLAPLFRFFFASDIRTLQETAKNYSKIYINWSLYMLCPEPIYTSLFHRFRIYDQSLKWLYTLRDTKYRITINLSTIIYKINLLSSCAPSPN